MSDGERLARLEEQYRHLSDDFREIRTDLKLIAEQLLTIRQTMSEVKGGWRVVLWIGGGGAVVGSALTAALAKAIPFARLFG